MGSLVLNSWKEIAQYLGRGVRTVERWEREMGLPVRRPHNHPRSPVIAIPTEIDEWLQHRGLRMVRMKGHLALQLELQRLTTQLLVKAERLQRNTEIMGQRLDDLSQSCSVPPLLVTRNERLKKSPVVPSRFGEGDHHSAR